MADSLYEHLAENLELIIPHVRDVFFVCTEKLTVPFESDREIADRAQR